MVAVALGIVTVLTLGYAWVKNRAPPKFLERGKRKKVTILEIKELSHDTKRFRLGLGSKGTVLGLPAGKHINVFAPNPPTCVSSGKWNEKDDADKGSKEIKRAYTPTPTDGVREPLGFADLVVKLYRPGTFRMPDGQEVEWRDGGKMGCYLDSRRPGDSLEITGPVGLIEYLGKGQFKLSGGRERSAQQVGMLAGGSGITPMLQVIRAALTDPHDATQFSLLYANKTKEDILVQDLLESAAAASGGRVQLHYTLDFPPPNWEHETGFISADMIRKCLPPPGPNTVVLMCGPPPMIEFACKKNLNAIGYAKDAQVMF